MFIGFTVNALLLGVMTTQVYMYYAKYKKDKWWLKAIVALLFLADTMNTVFDFIYLYRSLIIHFGKFAPYFNVPDPAITGIIAASVQLFFAWRVLVLTKTWVYPIAIGSMGLAGGISGIVTAFEVVRTPKFVDFRNFKATVIVWLAAEACGDVLITIILVWYLFRKHKTGFQRSDMIVDRIIRLTVQTGLITMIVASLDLLFFLIDPTGTHLLFNFPLCKLYSNSLMSSLNSRRGWKYGGTSSGESEGQIVSTGNIGKPRGANVNVKTVLYPEVFVHVEQHELRRCRHLVCKASTRNESFGL
ncbi:hypothetical protein BDZ97DRAFT_1670221 [Flammula alnicola]|nr:hypothetical protein BDZ97DRAFT_1670221 [Flammula alnicola]